MERPAACVSLDREEDCDALEGGLVSDPSEGVKVTAAALVVSLLTAAAAWSKPQRFRAYVERTHPCLAAIVDVEGKWDPTVDYGGGHGNTSESYGIGQANPGTKMAPYGRDWRTNPWTQLRWMIAYAQRYGSECGALAFREANGWW